MHKDKAAFDIPIIMYRQDFKVVKITTIYQELKDLKCALIVNIA